MAEHPTCAEDLEPRGSRQHGERRLYARVPDFGCEALSHPMRLLYIGYLWEGGTCLERMRVLERLGWEALPFDVTSFGARGTRLELSVAHRLNWGRELSALNKALTDFGRAERFDAVWVDKGVWIYPE